ncbi:MAG: hypothetical protein ACLP7P_09365 [Rhodomicrobium sp.]
MTKFCKKPLRSATTISVLAIIAAGVSAWDDDSDRIEFVTRGAGDAVEVNKATQTIDPWPPYVKNRHLTLDGKRAGLAIQRYETNRVMQPRPLNPAKAPEMPLPADNALPPPVPQQ